MVGMLLTGVFASKVVNGAGNDGLFYGNPAFFLTQLKAMLIAVAYSFSVSFGIFKFINYILPLRVSREEEEIGLDATQHDEEYVQGTLLLRKSANGHEPKRETELRMDKGKGKPILEERFL
jgi:Amt family ammonium transporter